MKILWSALLHRVTIITGKSKKIKPTMHNTINIFGCHNRTIFCYHEKWGWRFPHIPREIPGNGGVGLLQTGYPSQCPSTVQLRFTHSSRSYNCIANKALTQNKLEELGQRIPPPRHVLPVLPACHLANQYKWMSINYFLYLPIVTNPENDPCIRMVIWIATKI